MLDSLYQRIGWQADGDTPVAVVILSLAIMLIAGFCMTRITKRLRLPNVTAYIVAGILIGPYCLRLIPASIVEGSAFLPDIALAFIAFSTGEFFRVSVLRKNGLRVVLITILEACMASLVVFAACYGLLHMEFPISIVLSAQAAATAPASTMMTIRQTHAHGDFVDTLLQVVALDDVVGLVEYSVAISLAVAVLSGTGFSAGRVLRPILLNIGTLCLGALFGFLLFLLMKKRSTDNRLIVSISLLIAFCGICVPLDVSPLLGCMCMGMVYINLSEDEKLFKQLNYFSPPILLLFFVRSGVSFQLDALTQSSLSIGAVPLAAVGITYFFTRILGKYGGAWLGCLLTGKAKEVRRYLGLALIPQAGVAIGLAALGARTLGGEAGAAMETIVLASSVLYELIGPGCAKLSLYLSHSYSNDLETLAPVDAQQADGAPVREVDRLIAQIAQIQKNLPAHDDPTLEEEEAFTEGAEEQLAASEMMNRYRFRNRSR